MRTSGSPRHHRDVRTDLAIETHDYLTSGGRQAVPGVDTEEYEEDGVVVTRVRIRTPQGAQEMGKAIGNYVTIQATALRKRNRDLQEKVGSIFGEEVARLLRLRPGDSVFIVGLGNWNATPDALGPRVVNQVLVTRHLLDFVPGDLRGQLRSVSALAPGVLGITGIETGDIIRGIVDRLRPDVVIAVDALAARKLDRILTTVQIADSGIQPGSGVGNRRVAITSETLGCRTVAVGVPTVVHAMTIANDTIDILIDQLKDERQFYEMLDEMGEPDKEAVIREVLTPAFGDLMVTPKEIDVYVEDLAKIVAGGLNAALHEGIARDEIMRYLS
ncbi:MAG TPA: GPR endopeptidase [Bacillota bacterium]|jgi:spore protease